MSPSTPKKPAPIKKPATASTKVVRPKTPAEAVAERFHPVSSRGGGLRLRAITGQLRGLGMPSEEVDRLMAEIRASLGMD